MKVIAECPIKINLSRNRLYPSKSEHMHCSIKSEIMLILML